jgi:hypothetical protein
VVDPASLTVRSGPDIALIIAESADRTDLVLVGYVGIDPKPHAWVPDRAYYLEWYQNYVDHNPRPLFDQNPRPIGLGPVVLCLALAGGAMMFYRRGSRRGAAT